MDRDLRSTTAYAEAEEFFRTWMEPGFGSPSNVLDPDPSPDGATVAFAGSSMDKLEGQPASRICLVSTATGETRQVTAGPNDDRLPRWSPDGRSLGFLSDRVKKGVFQLYLLESEHLGEAEAAAPVEGTVEYFEWSPSGGQVLLGVAGLGADVAGAAGSGTTAAEPGELPSWVPTIEGDDDAFKWRRIWVLDRATGAVRCASPTGRNVWEATWAGDGQILAVVSDAPGEGHWYDARLALFDPATGTERVVAESDVHLGHPAASPDGARLAIVQAICSDRGLVAGDLLVFDASGGPATAIDTNGVDVTWVQFRDVDTLLYLGLRGLEIVGGEIDVPSEKAVENFTSDETTSVKYPEGRANTSGSIALALHSYDRPPSVALIDGGNLRVIKTLESPGTDWLRSISGHMEPVSWEAPDGLEIQGLLATPGGEGPFPLVLFVHGGPVFAWQNRWAPTNGMTNFLVSRGYAVLHPNPRGSTGRGQTFAGAVFGDMGGADSTDYLSGLDALIARGIADPERIAVMGGSYGGFMSAWLVTRTDRFAAALPMFPVTDWFSMHYTCNIAEWCSLFLDDSPENPTGEYFQRSPVFFTDRVTTPCLLMAGALDRCTPAGQALEFHNALLEHGVQSELVVYPGEGHGVRSFPAQVDFTARVGAFLVAHLS